MIRFSTVILQFGEMGEKTGWSYIVVTSKQAKQLKHDSKKVFRVKGKIDDFAIKGIVLMPRGNGDFIMPLNAIVRKGIKKNKGANITIEIEKDEAAFIPSASLIECLKDEPKALAHFNQLPRSHQKYYDNWISSAKTEITKAKRIAQAVTALARKMHYGEMMRSMKEDRDKFMGG